VRLSWADWILHHSAPSSRELAHIELAAPKQRKQQQACTCPLCFWCTIAHKALLPIQAALGTQSAVCIKLFAEQALKPAASRDARASATNAYALEHQKSMAVLHNKTYKAQQSTC